MPTVKSIVRSPAYYAGRASELKKEALILSSALKNARRCVRTLEMKITALDELTAANK
jgi:hypothetical protein